MNLRCIYCQTPFTLSRAEMLSAIVTMNERHQSHYDAHCPRCRRANSISRQRMELFFPNWQEAAKQQTAETAEESAPATAHLKTEPLPKSAKAGTEKKTAAAKPAAKKTAEKKPAAAKKTAEKKPAAAKPAAKKTTATKKK
jgi:hypothetical protein